MKRIILLIAFLSVSSTAVVGQWGQAGQEKNLRGLKGLRLVVMFHGADAINEAERPAILKLVEADASAKFKKAGIPLFRFANEVEGAGFPQLIVYITAHKPNGPVYPLATNVRFLQRVRLARDSSIEADLATTPTPTSSASWFSSTKERATRTPDFLRDRLHDTRSMSRFTSGSTV